MGLAAAASGRCGVKGLGVREVAEPGLGALRPVPWGLLGVRPGSLRGAAAAGSARGGFAGGVRGAGLVLGATGRGGGRRAS